MIFLAVSVNSSYLFTPQPKSIAKGLIENSGVFEMEKASTVDTFSLTDVLQSSKQDNYNRLKYEIPRTTLISMRSNEMNRVKQDLVKMNPVVSDQETILTFAKMSSNAYVVRTMQRWRSLPSYEDDIDDFGWDSDGLRGYIFTNSTKSVVIIAFKGTSTLLNKSPTAGKDKLMDNLMFSCCCGKVDRSWSAVCGCYTGGFLTGARQCDKNCLEAEARQEDTYFVQAKGIYEQALNEYPNATFWFTGHSLGGALAAILASTVPGSSAVTFASPGELMYLQRLGFEQTDRVWNFGHNLDPIYMGTCRGITSPCYLSGYAMESHCRQGNDCMYSLEGNQDISSHRIDWMIDKVISVEALPSCTKVKDCRDCEEWTFV